MRSGKQQGGWEETRLNFLRLRHTKDFRVRLMKICKFTREHLCLLLLLQHIFRHTHYLPRCTQRARLRADGQCQAEWTGAPERAAQLLSQCEICLGLLWWIQVPNSKPAPLTNTVIWTRAFGASGGTTLISPSGFQKFIFQKSIFILGTPQKYRVIVAEMKH